MSSYLFFWILLVLLIAVSLTIGVSSGIEGFRQYTFVPAWRRPWGGGPPPWRGWRRRWWNPWGWGRYGWGPYWGWDPRYYYVTYVEPFADQPEQIDSSEKSDPLIEYPPNGPAPTTQQGREPYQLLKDILPSVGPPENISCVNSRSCYATDFKRLLEPSSYRQMTNNYKHGYPDSCSSPFQELVLSFYKDSGMKIDVPKNCL
jgi:hypothetical protein